MTSVYQGDELQGEVDELQLPHRSVCPRNTLLHTFAQGNIFEGDGLVPLPGDGDRSRSVFFVLPIDVERVQANTHTHTKNHTARTDSIFDRMYPKSILSWQEIL